jgi:hypothetical protein
MRRFTAAALVAAAVAGMAGTGAALAAKGHAAESARPITASVDRNSNDKTSVDRFSRDTNSLERSSHRPSSVGPLRELESTR